MTFVPDMDEAERFVRLTRPDLAGETLQRPEQGREHFTFLSDHEAIRVARNEGVAQNMAREAAYLGAIDAEAVGGNFPALIDYDSDHHILSSARIEGSPLTPARLDAMPDERRQGIGRKIGALIGDLHVNGPQAPDEPAGLSNKSLSRIYAKMAHGDAEDIRRLRDVKTYVESSAQDNKRAMIHNDLGPGNILYDEKTGKIGFIDFSNVRADHAHMEFVTLLKNYGEDFTGKILDGYALRTGRGYTTDFIQTALDTSCMIHLPQENFKLPPRGRW